MLERINKFLVILCLVVTLSLTGYFVYLLNNSGLNVNTSAESLQSSIPPTPTLFIPTVSIQEYNQMQRTVEDNAVAVENHTEQVASLELIQQQHVLALDTLEGDVDDLEESVDDHSMAIAELNQKAQQPPESTMLQIGQLDEQIRSRLTIIAVIIGCLTALGGLMWYSAVSDIRAKTRRLQHLLTLSSQNSSQQAMAQTIVARPMQQPAYSQLAPMTPDMINMTQNMAHQNVATINAIVDRAVQDALMNRLGQVDVNSMQVNLLKYQINEHDLTRFENLYKILLQIGFPNTRIIEKLDERALRGTTIIPFFGAEEKTSPVQSLYKDFCLANKERMKNERPTVIFYAPDGRVDAELQDLYPHSASSDTPISTVTTILAYSQALSQLNQTGKTES